ncbi:MAG: hypothetical protein Q7J13_06735 [Brevundimonas sp.]|uniref:hypothetical protein n=1 Tax=Brevundimonas sp. TaxID=1871086 RepID=UPI0027174B06|nr:hypothetical protein [Brevundimonas sp.]MDO9587614.1 hypothetical protein [Brevundimonas sp.]
MSRPNDVVPADADQPNTLHALTRKRAELAGKIEHNQLELRRLIAELDHIDAVIRIFNPDIDIGAIRSKPVPPRHSAFKGEVTRVVLKTLRESRIPLTSRDLAMVLMKERGLNPDDRDLALIMVKRFGQCLQTKRRKGLVRVASSVGALQAWEIAR